VITVLCRPGQSAKITTLKLGHPILDDGIHWCVFSQYFCQNGVKFLWRLVLQEKKIVENSRLDVVLISRVAWDSSFQPVKQEKTYNSPHEQNLLSNDTIDSVLRHQEVGRAKYLSAPLRHINNSDYRSAPIIVCITVHILTGFVMFHFNAHHLSQHVSSAILSSGRQTRMKW